MDYCGFPPPSVLPGPFYPKNHKPAHPLSEEPNENSDKSFWGKSIPGQWHQEATRDTHPRALWKTCLYYSEIKLRTGLLLSSCGSTVTQVWCQQ
jgi:hypothetical protein